MNHETTLGVVTHLSIIIGLSIIVVFLIITQREDFKKDYRDWKGDKKK